MTALKDAKEIELHDDNASGYHITKDSNETNHHRIVCVILLVA